METQKLSLRGFSLAAGVLWAVGVLTVGLCNLAWPDYGTALLEFIASIYPGYHSSTGIVSVLVGTGYAFIDGLIGGFVFAALYNCFSSCCQCKRSV